MQHEDELFLIYSFSSDDNHLSNFCIQIDNTYIINVISQTFVTKKNQTTNFMIYIFIGAKSLIIQKK